MKRIAKLISLLGHPLVVGLFFGIYFLVTEDEPETIKYLPMIFASLVIFPMFGFIGYNVWKKNFKDFDVSHQGKRNRVYELALALLAILSATIYFMGYPAKALYLALTLLFHFTISYLINKKTKVSLHTSICYLFVWIFFPINQGVAIFLFFFGFFVAWSRLLLNRHLKSEVILGFLQGNLIGLLYILIFKFLYG